MLIFIFLLPDDYILKVDTKKILLKNCISGYLKKTDVEKGCYRYIHSRKYFFQCYIY
jgi:hypothetical protein